MVTLVYGYLIARESDQQIRRHTITTASRLNLGIPRNLDHFSLQQT